MAVITGTRYGMDETAHWPLFWVQMVAGTQRLDAGGKQSQGCNLEGMRGLLWKQPIIGANTRKSLAGKQLVKSPNLIGRDGSREILSFGCYTL